MTRSIVALGAVFALYLPLCGCLTGPNYLKNSVSDAWNRSYGENPIGTAAISDVLPVYPLLSFLALVPDVLVINPVQFWGFDVWRGKGAAFRHENPRVRNDSWVETLAKDDPLESPSVQDSQAQPASATSGN